MKPNSSKIAHFPIKKYYNLHFTTTPQNRFFPTIPHTYFSTKFRTTFNFIEVLTDDEPDTCATITQNSTNHIATLPTLPTRHFRYIEVPMKNPNIIKLMILTLFYTMFPIHSILKSQKLFHKQIILYNIKMTQFLFTHFHYTKSI